MNTPTPVKNCPKCGATIPAEAPQGLCPKCLLREASIQTETGTVPSSKVDLPTRETLAAAFPHLEILELIGQGGMGLVYKARQPKLDRFVALKILSQSLAADPSFTERFTREGRVLAKLNHPNIVTVHDFGQANGFFYLLMEFVNGVNLRQAMQAGRFTPAQALALVPEICEALQYAHTQGILHRDIKPENILLDTNGRVKIADFGIAKLIGEAKSTEALTGSRASIGTPHYMAPEQIERPAEVDHRADIYSLGVVLYELLTGELPLGRFPPPSERTPLHAGVDAVVLRALEKQREKRHQSAREVRTQVEELGDPSQRVPSAIRATAVRRPVWRVIALITMAAFGIIGLAWCVMWLVYMSRSKTSPTQLRSEGKTIEFSSPTVQPYMGKGPPRYFTIRTEVSMLPQEKLLALISTDDGHQRESFTHQWTQRKAGEKHNVMTFSWLYPETIDPEELKAAAARFESLNGKILTVPAGGPLGFFRLTNRFDYKFDREIFAWLQYSVEPVPMADGSIASVRVLSSSTTKGFTPTVGEHGVVAAQLDANLPAAHTLDCIGISLAGLEETTRISFARSEGYRSIGCEWDFPTTFTTEDCAEGARQLERATYTMLPKRRVNVFSVTNQAGDVLRGYLELVSK